MTLDPHSPLRLQDALDGRLAAADRLAVGEHLVGCEPCRRTLHALRWTRVRMAGAGAVLPIPARLETEIREALAAQVAGPASTKPRLVATESGQSRAFWQRCLEWWSRPR
jgi:anti-sigma factor RsiW